MLDVLGVAVLQCIFYCLLLHIFLFVSINLTFSCEQTLECVIPAAHKIDEHKTCSTVKFII